MIYPSISSRIGSGWYGRSHVSRDLLKPFGLVVNGIIGAAIYRSQTQVDAVGSLRPLTWSITIVLTKKKSGTLNEGVAKDDTPALALVKSMRLSRFGLSKPQV